jgi:hypothetical protein
MNLINLTAIADMAREEKQRRIEERTQPKGPIYQSTKAKRQIEGSQTFGYVKETEEA